MVFDQYLRTTKIPVLQHQVDDGELMVWWSNVVAGFVVPVVLLINGEQQRVVIAEQPTKVPVKGQLESFALDRNFYMKLADK